MAKRKQDEIPEEIKAMNFEEVSAAYEASNTPEHHAIFDDLVEKRDALNEQMRLHLKRTFDLNRHYLNLMEQRRQDRGED